MEYVGQMRTRSYRLAGDLAIWPFILCLPFMYAPRVLGGDTQPWIIITALLALLAYRPTKFVSKRDLPVLFLAGLAIVVYAVRSDNGYFIIRNAYIYIAFIVFWIIASRGGQEYFSIGIRWTIVVWFLIGAYQYIAIHLGYTINPPGRYLAGRMGPPSITAEASYYGSISMVQLMFLLSEKPRKGNGIFASFAFASVLMSGSLLSMLLLIFPLLRLPKVYKWTVAIVLPALIVLDYLNTSTGVASRLVHIFSDGFTLDGMLQDASLNLRAGHIYFTMIAHFWGSFFLVSPIDFMRQYNHFADASGVLIHTGTNYILPSIGQMVYGAGFIGVAVAALLLHRAQETCDSFSRKIEKTLFILACLFNPISIANPFLIIYARQRMRAESPIN